MAGTLAGRRFTDAEVEAMEAGASTATPRAASAQHNKKSSLAGRRFTDAEVRAMGIDTGADPAPQPAQPEGLTQPSGVEGVKDFSGAVGLLADQAGGGAMASLKRTYLGLKQLATYMTGDDTAKQAVNDEIKRMEEEYGPVLATPAGKVGNVAGVVGQFMVPGMAGAKMAKVMPGAAKLIRGVAGQPGSIGRAAITGGLFAGSQPVVQGTTDPESYAASKAGDVALGAGVGAFGQGIANKIFRGGEPVPDARQQLVTQAENLRMKLTPAQRTNSPESWKAEKKFQMQEGSQEQLQTLRGAQRERVDEIAAKTLGVPGATRMDSQTLLEASRNANQLYEPLKKVGLFPTSATKRMDGFKTKLSDIVDNDPDVSAHASRIVKNLDRFDGQRFISELGRLRNDINGAFEQGSAGRNKAESLIEIEKALQKYGEESVDHMARLGQADPNAVHAMVKGRQEWSTIHHLEKAYDKELNGLNVQKYLNAEAKRSPPTREPGRSPLDQRLSALNEAANVWKGIQPPAFVSRSSMTPEGLSALGVTDGKIAKLLKLTDIGKGLVKMQEGNAFNSYMRQSEPNALGALVGPNVSNAVRRMIPPALLAIQQDVNR